MIEENLLEKTLTEMGYQPVETIGQKDGERKAHRTHPKNVDQGSGPRLTAGLRIYL